MGDRMPEIIVAVLHQAALGPAIFRSMKMSGYGKRLAARCSMKVQFEECMVTVHSNPDLLIQSHLADLPGNARARARRFTNESTDSESIEQTRLAPDRFLKRAGSAR
jgi:hypothetical protein